MECNVKPTRYLIVALGMWVFLCATPLQALADECPRRNLPGPDCYTEDQANPLRITAYLLHPFCLLLEWTVARPFHALVSGSKELEYVFGHTRHGSYFEPTERDAYGTLSKRVAMKKPPAEMKVEPKEPVKETVIIKKVIVETTVYKDVPRIVEVERVILPDIAFRFDSADLAELGKGIIYLTAQKLKEKSDTKVVIEGHTDFLGPEEYNKSLGLRRAQMVKKELQQLGIEPERMRVATFGESRPLIDQETDWARAANRRVELRINGF